MLTDRIEIRRDGIVQPVERGRVSIRTGGQSQAEFDLTDTAEGYTAVERGVAYEVWYIVRHAETDVHHFLFRGTVESVSHRARTDTRRTPAVLEKPRTVTLVDPLRRYREVVAPAKETREDTDSRAELRRLLDLYFDGLDPGLFLIPEVPIPTITYTRDEAVLETLAPYLAPWEPMEMITQESAGGGAFHVFSVYGMIEDLPVYEIHSGDGYTVGTNSVALAEYQVAVDRLNQVKIVWTDSTGEGDGPEKVGERKEEAPFEAESDGSKTIPWKIWAVLRTNPDDPAETEERLLGQGVRRLNPAGDLVGSEEQRITYYDDWTRPKRETWSVTATVGLPFTGTVTREIESGVTEHTYVADEQIPGRWHRTKKRTVKQGVYTYVFSALDVQGHIRAATATPIITSNWNGTVDTSSQTTENWGEGQISTVTDYYQRSPAPGWVMGVRIFEDNLRDKPVEIQPINEQGDNVFDSSRRLRFEFRPEDAEEIDPPLYRAKLIDGTRIGYPMASDLADRVLLTAGFAPSTARVRLNPPDGRLYAPPMMIRLSEEMDLWDMSGPAIGAAGVWLVTGIDWEFGPPTPEEAPVAQYLHLFRQWGVR